MRTNLILILSVVAGNSVLASEANLKKCKSHQFMQEVRSTFACKVDWTLNSCSSFNLYKVAAPVAGAAVAGRVFGRGNSDPAAPKAEKWKMTRDSYVRLLFEEKEKWEQYDRHVEENGYEKSKKEQSLHRAAKEAQEIAADYKNKVLKPLEAEMGIETWQGRNDLKNLFDKIDELEKQAVRLSDGVPATNATPDSKLNAAYSQVKSEYTQKYVPKISLPKMSFAAALAGGGIALVERFYPDAVKNIALKTCTDGKNQTRLKDYLDVGIGHNNCVVNLNDEGELKLISMDVKDRNELFDNKNNGLLCDALIEKHDERKRKMNLLASSAKETRCRKGGLAADLEIAGHLYTFEVENIGGNLKITSPLGYGRPQDKKVYPEVIWMYDSQKGRLGNPVLDRKSAAANLLEKTFNPLGSETGAILQNTNLATLADRAMNEKETKPLGINVDTYHKDLLSDKHIADRATITVGQQSLALKQGLLDALANCSGSFNEAAGYGNGQAR